MEQLLAHLVGDYLLQSDWMAMNKSKRTIPCLDHVIVYTSVFLTLTTNLYALAIIGGVHFLLDRFPIIVRRLIWLRNHIGPTMKYVPFALCSITGCYDNVRNEVENKPYTREQINGVSPRLNYVTVWLYIITDNLLHLLTNYLALKYFA